MKLSKLLVVFSLFLLISANVYAFDLTIDGVTTPYEGPELTLVLNGEKFVPSEGQMPPVIVEDRTLVPVREVFEKLDGSVNWENEIRKVSVSLNGKNIELLINNRTVLIDGKETKLDVPAKIINNKTMVPVRFISENCGLNVEWDNATKTVTVSSTVANEEKVPASSDGEAVVTEEKIEVAPDEGENIVVDSPMIKFFNNKYEKSFGEDKGTTVTSQLLDLVVTNNIAGAGQEITVRYEDEKGNVREETNSPRIAEIKSEILKAFSKRYAVSGEYAEDGYLNKIIVKRLGK